MKRQHFSNLRRPKPAILKWPFPAEKDTLHVAGKQYTNRKKCLPIFFVRMPDLRGIKIDDLFTQGASRRMKFTQWISSVFASRAPAQPAPRLKISNFTRQTVLAHCAEVAGHGAARRKGLLGRTSLPQGEGLWIVPCEAVHTFFMKFPIDLVYLDRDKRVEKVRSNVRPWRMSACLSAHSIIELPVGTIQSTQTAPEDKLEFSPADPV
jgi:uncharacterized protein